MEFSAFAPDVPGNHADISLMSEPSFGAALPSSSAESRCARPAIHALVEPMVIAIFFCTLLASSALLFLLEPMFAKLLLPLLGGSPAVWNTCMVCFQALLLAAYAFGHWSIRRLGVRRQTLLQLSVLLIGAVALPVSLPSGWQQRLGRNPILWVLEVLAIGAGLPFFAVATTAPVLQRWFASTGHRRGADPYFLYTASNLGSLAALIAYPTLIEPLMRLKDQTHLWSVGYAGLFVLCAACALFVRSSENATEAYAEPITAFRRVRWIVLAMIPSSLLLGTTTFMTTDIAAVPMLWIIPLILYLLSFILVFARRPIVPHRIMLRLQPVCALGVAFFMLAGVAQPVWMVLIMHLSCLFISSMACHGELAADRPSVGRLTDFYLMMSLGGVIGGIFNALAAPLLFHSAIEYPIALIAACAICPRWQSSRQKPGRAAKILDMIWPAAVGALAWGMPRLITATANGSISWRIVGLGTAVMATALALTRRWRFVASLAVLFAIAGADVRSGQVLLIRRSFYGIHRIVRNPVGPFNDIFHGTTVHGRQFVDAEGTPCQATTALTYYTRTGPIGQLLTQTLGTNPAKRVSVVGLGVGSLAAYTNRGTELTYFEIDPTVRWLAEDSGYFSFLKEARNRGTIVRIIVGDARLTLRQMPSRSCDVLVIDAFCGDAVPVHLLTRQAMSIYLDKLDDQGVLAFHISNIYLDLLPICSALAADSGCTGMYRSDLNVSPLESAQGKCASQWVVVARNRVALDMLNSDPRWQPLPPTQQRVWTDDFSNILSIFRWQ
jgi:hypothetical protein